MKGAIAHIYPLLRFREGIEVAPVGRLDVLNCGGVVTSVCFWNSEDKKGSVVDVSLVDIGTNRIRLGEEACSHLKLVTTGGEPQEIEFIKIDRLSLLSVTVPKPTAKESISLQMTFASAKTWILTISICGRTSSHLTALCKAFCESSEVQRRDKL